MKFVFLMLILLVSQAYGQCDKPLIKVAVIDTGFGYNKFPQNNKLCYWGHKDFTKNGAQYRGEGSFIPVDTMGHGTNVVGLIEEYANKNNINYCIVILKFYSKNQSGAENLKASIDAINFANNEIKADYINYSGGGTSYDLKEQEAVVRFLNRGGKFIAAAGNEGQKLGFNDATYYPAMYDKRIVVVGNMNKNGIRSRSSNYGRLVSMWEIGEKATSYGITLSGTSMSTAIATGKILANSENKCFLTKK